VKTFKRLAAAALRVPAFVGTVAAAIVGYVLALVVIVLAFVAISIARVIP
jgi:hypothetical protein